MKLRPILRSEANAAVALLAEGFPVHSRQIWQESVRRLLAHVERDWDGSIGYIASDGAKDVGIGLAIPGLRSAYEAAPRKVVNLAAFYLRPGNEWMTTLFLRRMMKDPSVEYVDVTASVAMREVNRRLGFTDRTHGVVVVPTALAALRPAPRIRITPFEQLANGMLSQEHMELLARHAEMQAIALAVEVDGAIHPLILVRNYRKRVVGARVVLAENRELIRRAAGPLSRHLLRMGILFLEFDSPGPVSLAGSAFVTLAAPVQTTRPVDNDLIDHTFTELMFIPPPSNRPVFGLPRRRSSTAFPFPFGLVEASVTAAPTTSIMINLAEMLPV
jgi:hypothetical protein